MKKLCIYFKSEVSGALAEMGFDEYDGICLKARKDRLKKESQCIKGGKCKKWAETIPIPQPKKQRRYYEELPF